MKTSKNYLIILVVFLIAACNSENKPTENKVDSTATPQVDSNIVNDSASKSLAYEHVISFDSACILIQAFVKEYPVQSKSNGLYGYFTNDDLKLTEVVSNFNYCFDNDQLFFTIYRTSAERSQDNYDPTDVKTPMLKSAANGKYTGKSTDLSVVTSFLKDTPFQTEKPNVSIALSEIKNYREAFNVTFGKPNAQPYSAILFGEMKLLIEQEKDIFGIRCFWGYDATQTKNKIRLIVFAVGADGKNLCEKADFTDYKILDKAWP